MFRLQTDASYIGLGAILLQSSDGENWRIVTCASRRLSAPEVNYGITDLEGLAIVWAVQRMRPYILGKKVEVWTDHCALCALNKKSPLPARLARWAIILQEHDLDIKYIKGTAHRDVDCLSRAPVQPVDSTDEGALFINTLQEKQPEWWAEYHEQDSLAMRISKSYADGATDEYTDAFVMMDEDLIYTRDNKLYIPKYRREDYILNYHVNGEDGIHFGKRSTYNRAKNDVYWPGMKRDINEYCDRCMCSGKIESLINVIVPFRRNGR